MDLRWYRQDREKVAAKVRAGERPELVTTTAVGPLDALVAVHEELGMMTVVEGLANGRQRRGIADDLLMRTVAVLPFVGNGGFGSTAAVLLGEAALLLRVGWSPVQIRQGDNGRHRQAGGRQAESLPCHPDTLRDALARVTAQAWEQAQREGVGGLFARGLVRGHVDAVDGTDLGASRRVVALVCVSSARPLVVAWRYLEGTASEKGREAQVTRELIEQALSVGGPGCIGLLLADGLYADGPLLAWLKYQHGIDALVRLPLERLLADDLRGLVRGGLVAWTAHQYLRTIRGHKHLRRVELAAAGSLDSWESFRQAAASYGVPAATLWACLIRDLDPADPAADTTALVSTRDWAQPAAALHAFRPRWVIEDDTFRELKEGWGLERHPWGEATATIRGRVCLTLLAFNTAQLVRTRGGARLADKGIRRLRQEHRRDLGAAPVVLYLDGVYGVFALEDLLALLGVRVRESLLPHLNQAMRVGGPSP